MKTTDAESPMPSDDLMIRYWLGEASPSEREALEALFAEFPELRQKSADLFAGIKASGYSLDRETMAARTARIVASVQVEAAKSVNNSPRKHSSNSHQDAGKRTFILFKMGGVLIATIALVFGFFYGRTPDASNDMGRYHTFATKAGEQSTINLPDGSSVTINVASRVLIPVDYADGNRNVVLEGEALFKVEPNATSPFTVTSGPTVTRVLGTTFSIKRYLNDTVTSVAVRDGRVRVDSAIVSSAQQLLVFDPSAVEPGTSSGTTSRSSVYRLENLNSKKFEFANGVLAFDNVALIDAIPELERWYDVEIRLMSPELKAEKIDGGFRVGSQANLVSILELTFNVRVVQKGRVINVYRRHS